MALIKKHVEQNVEELPTFKSFDEVKNYFFDSEEMEKKAYAVEEIAKFEGGVEFLISELGDRTTDKTTATKIASVLSVMDPNDVPIENIMELLKLDNAYIRNLGITMLQAFGDSIKYYIVKFLIGDDRDLRIFAINVLGDVNFSESREMLIELLQSEKDINVAMTAVDYMGEIGKEEDIELLESLKSRFNDGYVDFAVDNAVKMIRG